MEPVRKITIHPQRVSGLFTIDLIIDRDQALLSDFQMLDDDCVENYSEETLPFYSVFCLTNLRLFLNMNPTCETFADATMNQIDTFSYHYRTLPDYRT